jgi:uncharacterized protein (DUF1786 family)
MGKLKENAEYIYESPDGGHTVYAREFGQTEKILVGVSLEKRRMEQELQDEELWHDMRKESKTNEALRKAIEHCIILYHVGKNGG